MGAPAWLILLHERTAHEFFSVHVAIVKRGSFPKSGDLLAHGAPLCPTPFWPTAIRVLQGAARFSAALNSARLTPEG